MTKIGIQRKLSDYNLEFEFRSIPFRNDDAGKNFPIDFNHYAVTIKRTIEHFKYEYIKIYYSMGSLIKEKPDLVDVLSSLISDTNDLDTFEDWCGCFGYDTDSIKANKMYKQCLEELKQLKKMFTEKELKELRKIFEDY